MQVRVGVLFVFCTLIESDYWLVDVGGSVRRIMTEHSRRVSAARSRVARKDDKDMFIWYRLYVRKVKRCKNRCKGVRSNQVTYAVGA